uniref:Elongator complex protein 5 n=1 Tax=Hucho hucho TaxID=62062 RepID=A0A4W5QBC5_9TELE
MITPYCRLLPYLSLTDSCHCTRYQSEVQGRLFPCGYINPGPSASIQAHQIFHFYHIFHHLAISIHPVLQGTEAGGLILIQDSVNYSGRHLKSYINTTLKRYITFPWHEYFQCVVHVLGFEASEDELKDGLDITSAQRLHFHNAYSDPLSWTRNSQFTVHQFTLEDIGTLLKQTPQAKAVTLIIDSLSWILRHHDPAVIWGAVRAVVSLLHSILHQQGTVGRIRHMATSVITVAPGTRGLGEEIFSINEDLTVTIQSKLSHPGHTGMNTEESELADPTANLTFNLRLSDTEREAKEKLALPFDFSKEKKSALLHLGPSSGRILYEPDANDDYDPEDPEDDLDF